MLEGEDVEAQVQHRHRHDEQQQQRVRVRHEAPHVVGVFVARPHLLLHHRERLLEEHRELYAIAEKNNCLLQIEVHKRLEKN